MFVIVLDDEHLWTQTICTTLEKLGHEVLGFTDPDDPRLQEWLAQGDREGAAVIDVNLRSNGLRVDAFTVVREWHAAHFRPAPLIFITADAPDSPVAAPALRQAEGPEFRGRLVKKTIESTVWEDVLCVERPLTVRNSGGKGKVQ